MVLSNRVMAVFEDLETRRQTIHMVSGLILAALVLHLDSYFGFVLLVTGLILTIAFSKMIESGMKVPLFSRLVRMGGRNREKVANGVMWYFVGVTIIMLIFGIGLNMKSIVVASMLIVAVGDSISTGLGSKVGNLRLPRTKTKTFEGTGLGFAFAFLGALFVLQPLTAFVGALAGMITEAYISPELGLDDNFTIPILSCSAMYILISVL
jgi:dolichol kinase